MARLAVLAGTGFSGEDLLYKLPWIKALEGHDVVVASRIDPRRHLEGVPGLPVRGVPLARLKQAFAEVPHHARLEVVYQDPGFRDLLDVDALEAWLGIPFAFLASMNRLFHDPRTGRDRRDAADVRTALGRYVRHFRGLMERHDTQWLATTLEDDLYCLAAVAVARRLGVRVVGTLSSRFPGRGVVFAEGFDHLMEWKSCPSPLDKVLGMYHASTVAGDALQRTQGYWDLRALPRRLADVAFARPYGAYRRNAVRHDPEEALIIPPVGLLRRGRDHAVRVARRQAARLWTHHAPTQPYILFPLHYTDDAQVTFREPYLDQVALVRAAARCLPAGHTLAVKPHPHYFATDQRLRDLRRIARTPGVRLLRADLPPHRLVRGAAAVLTVNSTTGIEALAQGVPVVTTGHDWYCHQPPCHVVRDLRDLPAALVEAVHAARYAREGQDFVRRAHANTVWTEGEGFGHGFYGLTPQDGRNVAQALDRALAEASV